MVTEDDVTLGAGHTIQYADHVSQKCTLETYIILLTHVTPIISFKNKDKPQQQKKKGNDKRRNLRATRRTRRKKEQWNEQ